MRMPPRSEPPAQMRNALALVTDLDRGHVLGSWREKRGKFQFRNGAMTGWIRVLEGLAEIGKSAGDNAANFLKFQYAVGRNLKVFRQAETEKAAVCRSFYRTTMTPERRAFAKFVRDAIPASPLYVVNDNMVVDAARYCIRGVSGFSDWCITNPDLFDYFDNMRILRGIWTEDVVKTGGETAALIDAGARDYDAMVTEILAFGDEFETVEVYRVPRVCRPFRIGPYDARALAWMFR